MGRKTFNSIPKEDFPLDGRINMIISESQELKINDLVFKNNW